MKETLKQIPILGTTARWIYRSLLSPDKGREPFPGSAEYWEKRYAAGGNSGVGSYALFAEFKAEVLNEFVARKQIPTVIEFGCGDGNQLTLANYPKYLGFDVSSTAIAQCQKLFRSDPHKSFRLMSEYRDDTAELTLSLDVIYHLVEDAVFETYMRTLFGASRRFVIVYASNSDDNAAYEGGAHVKHRHFTEWVAGNLRNWRLIEHIPNRYPYRGDFRTGSFADFFVYEKA